MLESEGKHNHQKPVVSAYCPLCSRSLSKTDTVNEINATVLVIVVFAFVVKLAIDYI